MPINTLATATIFQTALDKQCAIECTSGWMESNAKQVKYNGGADIKIPKLSVNGLGDYDRDDGYPMGAATLAYETRTMTQDRGRKFQLDAMDVDENNFVATASNVMSAFQADWVIPEIDAYRYSKIFSLASTAGNVNTNAYTPVVSTMLSTLRADIKAVQDVIGDQAQLIITMSFEAANVLDMVSDVQRHIDVANFKQGGVDFKIKTFDGHIVKRVPSARMKSAYTFYDGTTSGQETGGFVPTGSAVPINWIICPTNVPIAVSKTDKTRIFTPENYQKADAWCVDYRKFHDLWITDNKIPSVRVNKGSA